MNCNEFREQLFSFIDGELTGAAVGSASAHVEACTDCAERAEFERELESRMSAALLSGAEGFDVSRALAGVDRPAEPVTAERAGTGRVIRFPFARRLLAVAATLLIAVQAAWFFCIPPFECSYLQAVELSTREEGTALRPGVAGPRLFERIDVPSTLSGYELQGDPVGLRRGLGDVGYEFATEVVRARYALDGESFDVVWSRSNGMEPSFRRKRDEGGQVWWIAEETGNRIVAWMCPDGDTLCTLVGDLPEDRLLEVAGELRAREL